jgi:hypothetical protein
MRYATVRNHETIERLEAFLPMDYRVIGEDAEGTAIIAGEDYAGWTLEDYVIPRAASGLIWVTELREV